MNTLIKTMSNLLIVRSAIATLSIIGLWSSVYNPEILQMLKILDFILWNWNLVFIDLSKYLKSVLTFELSAYRLSLLVLISFLFIPLIYAQFARRSRAGLILCIVVFVCICICFYYGADVITSERERCGKTGFLWSKTKWFTKSIVQFSIVNFYLKTMLVTLQVSLNVAGLIFIKNFKYVFLVVLGTIIAAEALLYFKLVSDTLSRLVEKRA